jgi:hypothetical protein
MPEHPATIRVFNDFSISLMLADSAQAVQGKLFVLGGGWNMRSAQPTPCAIAAVVSVPWTETNRRHALEFSLLDGNGRPVSPAEGAPALTIGTEFEVGRGPGLPPGIRLNVPIAINMGPLQLAPGQYEWRVTLDGRGRDDWRLPFTVLAQVPGQPPQG